MCLLLYLSCIGWPLWDLCKCKLNFVNIAKVTEAIVSFVM